jgi:hypothetical protein
MVEGRRGYWALNTREVGEWKRRRAEALRAFLDLLKEDDHAGAQLAS